MSFIWPWMLLSLFFVPLFVWFYSRLLHKRQVAATELGSLGVLQTSSGAHLGRQRHLPPLVFLFGLTLLLIGLARPETYVELPSVEGNVILVFDVSSSMAAEDLEPSRMEAAKNAARIFVENQPDTIQIGVVAFSNGGLVVQPPTNDQAAILDTIRRLSPQGATSLGQGIFSALNAIAGDDIQVELPETEGEVPSINIGSHPSSVILLLSDGENTSSPDPLEVAQLAADASVRIYTVGIGSPEGTVLELDGFNIVTQLNEANLQEIANVTNGAYYRAENEGSLDEIYKNVDLRLAINGEKMEVTALFAGVSMLIFLIGGGLSLLWFGRMPL
ncbi:MAG: VWA domain-containing protein [Anaerolineales bacterium]